MGRETILAGDIGGTNTRLLLFEIHDDDPAVKKGLLYGKEAPGMLLMNKKYMNQDFESFVDVVKAFFKDAFLKRAPVAACFSVAGPVKDNAVRFTNRESWSMDGEDLQRQLGIHKVSLINDFLAVGYGLLTLDEEKECLTLQAGARDVRAPIACIGAGTGLGQCFLTPSAETGLYQCFPSEGGHAEFAPRNELEVGLLNFLKKKFKQQARVSVERVISGSGLVNVYEYLSEIYPEKIDHEVHKKIEAAGDLKGAVIAQNQTNELCRTTMQIFITAYGAEAGVACLKWLPYGGLYLTGGLTPKNIDLIKNPEGPFLDSLLDKGRVSGMLCSIPIFAVLVENLGERGAHRMAFHEYAQLNGLKAVKDDAESEPQTSQRAVSKSSSISRMLAGASLLLAGILVGKYLFSQK